MQGKGIPLFIINSFNEIPVFIAAFLIRVQHKVKKTKEKNILIFWCYIQIVKPLFRKHRPIPKVLDGSAIVQVVSCLFLTTEARIQSLAHPCGIWGRDSGNGAGVSPSTLVFSCQLPFHEFLTLIYHQGLVQWTHLQPQHEGTQSHLSTTTNVLNLENWMK
jgi:hypothetical protein